MCEEGGAGGGGGVGGQREPRDGGREFWYTFGLEFWNFGIPLTTEIRTFIKTFLLSNNVNCNF